MGRLVLIGDVHLGLGYPNKYNKWFKIHKEYFEKFLFPTLDKQEIDQEDEIILLGDFFDNRNYVPIDVLNYGISIIDKLSQYCKVHMIVGNHDLWTKSNSDINSVNFLELIPNVKVYSKTKSIYIMGYKVCMMPYIDNMEEQISEIDNNRDCEYLFCHSDLNGARMHLSPVVQNNTDKIDIKNFSKFKGVYSGHIHIRQEHKNFTFVGNIFQMDRNDRDNIKGITILNLEDNTTDFIENNISPIFKKIEISNKEDLRQLESIKNSKDYIDLSISNNLLITQPLIRKKLEILLEEVSLNDVQYVDDIQKEELKNVNIDFMENEYNYKEFITTYIDNQSYDDKVKEKLKKSVDEIINIYNTKN